MSKKKVLVFITQLLETGGIESHLKEFCFQLKESNVSVSILVLNSKASKETETFYKNVCENSWTIYHQNIIVRYFKLLFLIPILNLKGFSTLYSNGQGDSIYYLRQLLFTIQHWVHHHHTSGDNLDQKTWTRNYLKTLQNANTIVACAKYNATLMSKALNRNVTSIPCFSRSIIVEDKVINPQKIKIAYIGRLIKEKGIETLCRLSNLDELKHIEFSIWGEGSLYPPSYFKSFPRLKYMGSFKNKDGLTKALNGIDAFILYSTHPEGLPISLLEVMSTGLPWIATNVGGIGELSIDQDLNYLLPSNIGIDELVKHIQIFTKNLIEKQSVKLKQVAAYNNTYSADVLTTKWNLALAGNNNI